MSLNLKVYYKLPSIVWDKRMLKLRTTHAVYKDGKLVFSDESVLPANDTEVVVTFLSEDDPSESGTWLTAIQALRGHGKGEALGAALLRSRREDRECDERGRGHLPV